MQNTLKVKECYNLISFYPDWIGKITMMGDGNECRAILW